MKVYLAPVSGKPTGIQTVIEVSKEDIVQMIRARLYQHHYPVDNAEFDFVVYTKWENGETIQDFDLVRVKLPEVTE